jgi:hypothetical protein
MGVYSTQLVNTLQVTICGERVQPLKRGCVASRMLASLVVAVVRLQARPVHA